MGLEKIANIYLLQSTCQRYLKKKVHAKDTNKKGKFEEKGKAKKMRQRELLEFRTPQHPSSGSNNWGGASPLLARDIPKESLEQRYLRLNTIRTRDEIFLAEEIKFNKTQPAPRNECPPTPSRKGILLKLIWPDKAPMLVGSNPKKKRWFTRWDPKRRWPQGWCWEAIYDIVWWNLEDGWLCHKMSACQCTTRLAVGRYRSDC